jgi:hypothetical protein
VTIAVEIASNALEGGAMPVRNIFEAVASRDAATLIGFVDPSFREAAQEASARARAKGILCGMGAGTSYPIGGKVS